MRNRCRIISLMVVVFLTAWGCKKGQAGGGAVSPPPVTAPDDLQAWITTGNETALLQEVTGLKFGTAATTYPVIHIDSSQTYQTVDGFGYTLTGGSADLIQGLSAATRTALLQELFSTSGNGIGVSYLRVSIGSSDLSASVYSYNDLPAGVTDENMQQFSLGRDTVNLVPVLQSILAINPSLQIMASPWSAPAWMKDNRNPVGGSLLPQYYQAYALYFVRYVQHMLAKGIPVHAVTIQNEPLHDGNNPSMKMTAAQQTVFIKNFLGPAFRAAGLQTKIIIWDHNCDRPDYPLEVLGDPAARAFIDGSAFHLYAGDISALSQVRNAYPDRNIYFTEQYTASNGSFGGDLKWHMKNVIIGSMRNWSRVALEWNLANDPSYGPHTPGGCTVCKGALTIQNGYIRNVSYYIIAHASKFVPPGSVRIGSSQEGFLYSVAFRRPDGKKAAIILNDGPVRQSFHLRWGNRWVTTALDAGTVGTYLWN